MDDAGDVDILVANAGVGIPQDLAMLSDSEIAEAVRINLLAPAVLARAAVNSMTRRGRGHIVFISSGAGLIATPGNGAVYTATKWGLRGLGLALRQELHGTGVGVSTIFPGPIRDAGMLADTGAALPRGFGTSSPGTSRGRWPRRSNVAHRRRRLRRPASACWPGSVPSHRF